MKKFILNADDLAKSEYHNSAILEGYKFGLLKSTSVMVNMPCYQDALKRVILPNRKLGVGIHLNLTEGRALNTNLNLLTNQNGDFNNSYLSILLNSNKKEFLSQVEQEFRSQIELAREDIKLTHIDSHVHIHSIPNIFKITARLASEYNIKQIRTQLEIPYFVKGKRYNPINLIKVLLLNYFSLDNKDVAKKYNLKTNDFLLGVSYTGMMSDKTILEGLKKIKKDCVLEALIHPCLYNDDRKNSHTKEFEITKNDTLKSLIQQTGFEISNYIML